MNIEEILTSFLTFMGSLAAIVASVWFIVQIFDVIANHKNRRDQNRMWRKDLHIQYLTTYNSIIKSINSKEKINDDDLTKILALTYSSGRNNFNKVKKIYFSKKILIKQLKNIDLIDNDFMLNKNLSINQIIKKRPKFKLNNLSKIEMQKLLIIITTFLFTENIDLIKYDEKFDIIIKFIKELDLIPKVELISLFQVNKK